MNLMHQTFGRAMTQVLESLNSDLNSPAALDSAFAGPVKAAVEQVALLYQRWTIGEVAESEWAEARQTTLASRQVAEESQIAAVEYPLTAGAARQAGFAAEAAAAATQAGFIDDTDASKCTEIAAATYLCMARAGASRGLSNAYGYQFAILIRQLVHSAYETYAASAQECLQQFILWVLADDTYGIMSMLEECASVQQVRSALLQVTELYRHDLRDDASLEELRWRQAQHMAETAKEVALEEHFAINHSNKHQARLAILASSAAGAAVAATIVGCFLGKNIGRVAEYVSIAAMNAVFVAEIRYAEDVHGQEHVTRILHVFLEFLKRQDIPQIA